jgi:hypothetical protein
MPLPGAKVPLPNVVHVPELVEEIPLRTGLAALGQSARFAPASTKGPLVNVIRSVSVTCRQLPLPVELSRIITLPAVVSALLGIYETFIFVLFGVNVPVPVVDHEAPAEILKLPLRLIVPALAQTVMLDPAFTLGEGVTLTVNCENTGLQPPLLVLVIASVNVPPEISELLGMYVPLIEFGLKMPLPLDVHVPEPVEDVPVKTTLALLAQTVWLRPAVIVGGAE